MVLEFNELLKEKNLLPEIVNPKSEHKLEEITEYISSESQLNRIIENISVTGESHSYDWKSIKNFVLYKIKESILLMQGLYPDLRERQGETFNDQLDSIIQNFISFEDR